MPVPRYERQVQPTGLPAVRGVEEIPAAAAGAANAAPAVAAFSQQVFEMAQAEKRKADETAAQDGWAKLVRKRNDVIQNGLPQYQGTKAQYAEVLLQDFDAEADEAEKGMGNEVQREMFRAARAKERLELQGRITGHVANEGERLADSTFKAAVGTAIDDGVLNFRQPGKVDAIKRTTKALIENRAQQMGWSEDVTRQAVEGSVSQMHRGIIARELANNNVPTAEQWYLQHKKSGELTGEDITWVEAQLQPAKERYQTGRMLQAAQSLADEYFLKYAKEELAFEDFDAKHRDKPYYQETARLLKDKFRLREQKNQFEYNSTFQRAAEIAFKGEEPPADLMANLLEADRNRLAKMKANVGRGASVDRFSEDAAIGELKMMAAERPDVFAKEPLGSYNLSEAGFKEIRALQLGMISKSPDATKAMDGFATQRDIIEATLSKLGQDADLKKMEKKDAENYHAFMADLDRRTGAWASSHGKAGTKDIPRKDLEGIVEDMSREYITKRRWFGNKKAPAWKVKWEDVHDDIKNEVIARLVAKGIRNPSANQLMDEYLSEPK